MCGRFSVAPVHSAEEIAELFEAVARAEVRPRYNVAPSQPVPIVRAAKDGGRELVEVRWGLIPSWAKNEKVGFSNINARMETVARAPAFREAFAHRRCVVLATGFYEWRATAAKTKQPYNIAREDGQLMPLAAVWERWHGEGKTLETCAIITTDARGAAAAIHDRMPVMLREQDVLRWLDPHTPPGEAQELLTRVEAEKLRSYPVSTLVNSPKNDAPELLEKVKEGPEQVRLF